MKKNKIITKYILLVSLVFLLLLFARIYYDYTHQQEMLKDKLSSLYNNIHTTVNVANKSLVDKYDLLASYLIHSKKIYNYLKEDKREALYALLKNDYKGFQKIDPDLLVMHFLDTKNITVLRMHKPNSYDDNLTLQRPIVRYVNQSLLQQSGFEVGKNGIVYRVTNPFIYKNEHVGVLEFGVKLNYFTDLLQKNYNISYAHLVKTESLEVLTVQKKYQQKGEYSIVFKDSMFDEFIDEIDLQKEKQIIKKKGKTYLVCGLNLRNYENFVISKIVVVDDITKIVEKNMMWFMFVNISSIFIYIFTIALVYFILDKYAKEIQAHLITISKLHKKSKFLQNKADTDELTGLYNKRYFDTLLDKYLQKPNKYCILFLDIDHFKDVNDNYGHLVGDEVLKNLAKLMKNNLRINDIVARWGGEEFIILLDDISLQKALKKTEFLRKLVEVTPLANELFITISIGIVEVRNDENKNDLIQRVDNLLYQSKENGRNCISF